MKLKEFLGSGGKIWALTIPFLAAGLALNILFPSVFRVGGPSTALTALACVLLAIGVTAWFWSIAKLLVKIPRKELITTGPYALVKHPIYTSVGLLVFPSLGLLFNTWLGVPVGIVLYIGARIFAPEEEAQLSKTFGPAWDDYRESVKIPWL